MRVLTINELMRLTRIELCDLAYADHKRARIRGGLAGAHNALTSLRNIRYVLARRDSP